jgi:hypothetical protein
MWESYYNSLASVFHEVCKILRTPKGANLYPGLNARLLKIAKKADNIAWGYGDTISEELARDMNAEMTADSVPILAEVQQPPPEMGTEVEPAEAVVVTLVDGVFMDRSHPTSGRVLVLNDGSTQRFLRFEDFETDNGPDLNVYLSSAAPDASVDQLGADFVDLGDLKGNVGPQNYEIPPDVDLDRYSTVVVWCVRFGVAFGSADLIPPS